MRSTTAGSELSIHARYRHLAVVVTTCPTCGTLKVFRGTRLVKTIDLSSSTTKHGQVIQAESSATLRSDTIRLRQASAAELYRTVGEGHRAMFGMAQMIPSADRWAIVAYLRALQLSQGAELAGLPPEDRARLEAAR